MIFYMLYALSMVTIIILCTFLLKKAKLKMTKIHGEDISKVYMPHLV